MAGKYSIEAIFKAKDQFSGVIDKFNNKLKTSKTGWKAYGVGASSSMYALSSKLMKPMTSMAVSAGKLGLTASMAAVGAAGYATYEGIKSAAEYEDALTSTGAAVGKTRGEITSLDAAIRKTALTGRSSATELAKASGDMLRAGYSESALPKDLVSMSAAADAGRTDVGTVSEALTAIMIPYGISNKRTTELLDKLVILDDATKADLPGLAAAAKYSAQTARTLGFGIEDYLAATASLQQSGLSADESGTSFNALFAHIAAHSKEIDTTLKQYGVSFGDEKTGQAKSLPEMLRVLSVLNDKVGKSGGKDKEADFYDVIKVLGLQTEFVGNRGARAYSILTSWARADERDSSGNLTDRAKAIKASLDGKSLGSITDLVKSVNNRPKDAAGNNTFEGSVIQRKQELINDSTIGRWTKFSHKIDEIKLKLFDIESPGLTKLLDQISKFVDDNNAAWIEKAQKFVTWLTDDGPALVKTVASLGKELVMLAEGIPVFYALATAVGVFSGAIALSPVGQLLLLASAVHFAFRAVEEFFGLEELWNGFMDSWEFSLDSFREDWDLFWKDWQHAVGVAVGYFLRVINPVLFVLEQLLGFDTGKIIGDFLADASGKVSLLVGDQPDQRPKPTLGLGDGKDKPVGLALPQRPDSATVTGQEFSVQPTFASPNMSVATQSSHTSTTVEHKLTIDNRTGHKAKLSSPQDNRGQIRLPKSAAFNVGI